MVQDIQASSIGARREGLERLCRLYWKPVYYYIRWKWSKNREDTKDLTQAFLLWVLDGGALQRYQADRATFRTFLKMILRGFKFNQDEAMNALKRGGNVKRFALDSGQVPLQEILPDPKAEGPEEIFDRTWKKEILEAAVKRTREWYSSTGREIQFQVFEEYELKGSEERVTYGRLAEKLDLKETKVRNYLFEVRERLREEIRAEISQTVGDASQLEDEWNALFVT